jgi:hypothetical protein
MSSATELREQFRKRKPVPIIVTVPDTDLTFECKRPNLMHMVSSGFMAWPALTRVRELTKETTADESGVVLDNRPMPTVVDKAEAVGVMLDEWVCAAAVSPRVVMYEHEQGDGAIWIEDVPFEIRQAIFNATFVPPSTAGADFRSQADGAPPGQGGETVRDTPVDAVGSDGSDGGTGS